TGLRAEFLEGGPEGLVVDVESDGGGGGAALGAPGSFVVGFDFVAGLFGEFGHGGVEGDAVEMQRDGCRRGDLVYFDQLEGVVGGGAGFDEGFEGGAGRVAHGDELGGGGLA